jgi:hypothetical protein
MTHFESARLRLDLAAIEGDGSAQVSTLFAD